METPPSDLIIQNLPTDLVFEIYKDTNITDLLEYCKINKKTYSNCIKIKDYLRKYRKEFQSELDDQLLKHSKTYLDIKLLLELGANPNFSDLNRDTILLFLAKDGNIRAIKLLLEYGANVNAVNNMDDTPLLIAIKSKSYEIMKLLIENGADVNMQSEIDGTTPLMGAVYGGSSRIVSLLLESGADVNATDTNDNTALIIACDKNRYTIIIQLVNHGADINQVNGSGYSVLFFIHNNHIAETLLKLGANVNIKDEDGVSPLLYYIDKFSVDPNLIKLLINYGADINAEDDYHRTPLLLACSRKTPDIVELLLQYDNLDIHATNQYGNNALSSSVISGYTEIVKILLDHGADINQRDEYGRTPLMDAIINNKYEVAAYLVKEGADVNIKDGKGRTALMILIISSGHHIESGDGVYEMIELLLEYEANTSLKDKKGNTALDYAIENDQSNVIELLT